MIADPHGNGRAGTDKEGRKRAISQRLNRMGDTLDALERTTAKLPARRPPKIVRVQPFRSIKIFLAISAMMLLTATFLVIATKKERPATVNAVTYSPMNRQVTGWLLPDGSTPERMHRHYQLVLQPGCRVTTWHQSPDGKDVYVELECGLDHAINGDGPGFRTGSPPR
jgi:hypothetical protein